MLLQDLLIEKMNIVLETLEKEVNEISGCVTKIKNIKQLIKKIILMINVKLYLKIR